MNKVTLNKAEGRRKVDRFFLQVDFLHNGRNGRLDMRSVAELFGLSLSDLARYIGVDAKTLENGPDSILVHEKLLPFEQIAGALDVVGGDVGAFRRWLNAPNGGLDGQPPIKLIQGGKAKELASQVQSVLFGQPA
jgi:hypothetical protein